MSPPAVNAWILSVEGDVEAFRFEVGVVEKVPEQSTVLGEAVTTQAASDASTFAISVKAATPPARADPASNARRRVLGRLPEQ